MKTGNDHKLLLPLALLPMVLGILFALAWPIAAKQMYKWQDENGIWHFSDVAPDTDQPVESRVMRVEPRQRLLMKQGGEKHAPTFHFTNNLYGPMQLEIDLTERENIAAEPELPERFVLEALEGKTLVELSPTVEVGRIGFRIVSRYVPGFPGVTHDNVRYLPPFPAGESYPISQGFKGTETHSEKHALYAVDIVMPIGTPILAARDGIVMDVEDDFFGAGTDRDRFGARANIVRILHEDGTMAVYAHLKLDSIIVHPGTAVLMGEQIAESGNTGFSSGPHLHFAIQRNGGMVLESLPFTFQSPNGRGVVPDRPMPLHGVPVRH